MEILLNPIGSAGDVHPFVGLGQALRARGHRVTFLINPHFRPLIERLGFASYDLGTEAHYQEIINDPDLWHTFRAFRVVAGSLIEALPIAFDVIEERRRQGPLLVIAGSLSFGALVAREALGVPTITVHLQPAMFRSDHEFPTYPGVSIGPGSPRWLKRLFYRFVDWAVLDRVLAPDLNAFRARQGLPPVRRILNDFIHSADRILALFPDWFAARQPDWPTQTSLVGFPLYDERDVAPLSPDLLEFLDEGEPPIVFAPGSANVFVGDFFRESAAACTRLGRRGLLLTRHPEQVPADLPPGVRHFDYAPFGPLLPRAAALVHHGGVGTMAQALAAGTPQLIRPLAHDQHDNAARVERLGVGLTLDPKHYRADRAATALAALVEDSSLTARCREVASRFVGTDPLGLACDEIEAFIARNGPVDGPSLAASQLPG